MAKRSAITKVALADASYAAGSTFPGPDALVKEYGEALLLVDFYQIVSGAPSLELIVRTHPDTLSSVWTLLWKPQFTKASDGTLVTPLTVVDLYSLKLAGPLGGVLRADLVVGGSGAAKVRAWWDCKS